MHVHVDKLIKSIHLVGVLSIALAIMTVLALMFWKGGRDDVKHVVNEFVYMQDQREIGAILAERDRFIKVTDMYNRIHAVYGNKYHSKYNTPDQWMYQGMKKEIRSEFFRLMYQYSRMLSLPYFALLTTSKIESDMNPISRTYKEVPEGTANIVLEKNGKYYVILEAGIFNQRQIAVEDAFWILHNQMTESQRKVFSFKFNKMEDLYDPINALKIAAILFYGSKVQYNSDPSWYVTSVHWGKDRIWKYYINGVLPPDQFIFNKGTVREDARSPFTYYFYWNAYNSQFEKFTTKVYIEHSWEVAYKNACSKEESLFIDMHKYVGKMISITEKRQQAMDEFKIQDEKYKKAWEKKLRDTDNKYRELVGLLRRGKGRTAKDIFKEGIAIFKGLADDVYSEEVDKMRKVMIIILGIGILFVLCLAMIGVYFLTKTRVLKLYRYFKKKWIRYKRKRRRRLNKLKPII